MGLPVLSVDAAAAFVINYAEKGYPGLVSQREKLRFQT